MEEDTGRCVNCGFLGKKWREETVSICYEATPRDREDGSFSPFEGVKSTRPCCYLNKAEYTWDIYKGPDTAQLFTEISEDRKCSYWYPYTEFRSPREHYEEYKMLELERRREEFEQRMETERKGFELKLDERNREERKRTGRIMIRLTVAAIIFAFAEVASGLMGITSDSWILRFFR